MTSGTVPAHFAGQLICCPGATTDKTTPVVGVWVCEDDGGGRGSVAVLWGAAARQAWHRHGSRQSEHGDPQNGCEMIDQ